MYGNDHDGHEPHFAALPDRLSSMLVKLVLSAALTPNMSRERTSAPSADAACCRSATAFVVQHHALAG